jgi:ribonuclease-3
MTENETKQLKELGSKLGLEFKDLELLKGSLIHRSYLNELRDSTVKHNERLEFLGDAVLELIVTEYLYSKYPDKAEGDLTSFRAAAVRTESLYESAAVYDLGKYLYMSKGEESSGGRNRPYILANAFEAVLGAIYLDRGYDVAKSYLERNIITKIAEIVDKRLDIDSKSKLQEIAQEKLNYTPVYEYVSSEGPEHDKEFTMSVSIKGKEFAQGKGKSKQEAEQVAAAVALTNWEDKLRKYFN